MPDIRYVVISDMHLGEEDSVLTCLREGNWQINWREASPTLISLVECLRYLIKQNQNKTRPTLILLGDILEFALATDNEAAMGFERFIELIMPRKKKMFNRIFYVPGNHDHHLWESARETQYVEHVMGLSPGSELDIPWHTTNMFMESEPPLTNYFLTRLIQRYPGLKRFVIATAYPNFGLITPNRDKCVVLHHGHYVESLYLLMSVLKRKLFPEKPEPEVIWDIEGENFAWIDFFWSMAGRSGEVGKDMEMVYEKMNNPERFRDFLMERAEMIADKEDIPWIPGDWAEEKMLKALATYLAERAAGIERGRRKKALDDEGIESFKKYVSRPVKLQIANDLKGPVPRDVTFVFGHTHKPFEETMQFDGYPAPLKVYNTGGWVVDTEEAAPVMGGALILLDENLDAVSLRMYNESQSEGDYKVKVAAASPAGAQPTPFYLRMLGLVDAGRNPWKSFSETVAKEVKHRAARPRQ